MDVEPQDALQFRMEVPKRLSSVQNGFSVDVEDYFHTEAMASATNRELWGTRPCRVESNTRRLLEILQRHNIRGTFFFLGWVAERFPHLVREVLGLGHEVASHSYWHRPVFRLTPAQFKEDTLRSKQVIEDAGGVSVLGYRAPTFSILPSMKWAFEVLAELGFLYDSSSHPIHHDLYGNPNGSRQPFLTGAGSLLEFPIATLRFGSRNYPLAGGGYFRALPYLYVKKGIQYINAREGLDAIFYVHPWELDPDQPRLPVRLKSRVRQYIGLHSTVPKLEKLLHDFEFVPLLELYKVRFPSQGPAVLKTCASDLSHASNVVRD
jgi:polysaccharide deacetylase family protein (PEP-CTERM system associated)